MHKATDDIPGNELVEAGLTDLERGELTVKALLVAVGAPRLRALGLPVPETPSQPELALHQAIGRLHSDDTHSGYNALIRRLVSYERELERRRFS